MNNNLFARASLQTNTANDDTDNVKTENVMKILDSEIEMIRGAQNRQGLTSWGLLATLATLIWLAGSELRANVFDLATTGALILLFSTLIDGLRWLPTIIPEPRETLDEPIKFRWSRDVFKRPLSILSYEVFRSGLLLFVGFYVAKNWWLPLAALSVGYLWYTILIICVIAVSYKEMAVKIERTKQSKVHFSILVASWLISFVLYLFLVPPPIGEIVDSYRAAGLLTAIIYVFQIFAVVTRESPLLETLINIRRDLAFNEINSSVAAQKAQIALTGMQTGDAIQKELYSFLESAQQLNFATDDLNIQIDFLAENLPNADDNDTAMNAKMSVLAIHDRNCHFIFEQRKIIFDSLMVKSKQLSERRLNIQINIPESNEFFERLDVDINAILKEVDEKFGSCFQRYNQFHESLKAIIEVRNSGLPDRFDISNQNNNAISNGLLN